MPIRGDFPLAMIPKVADRIVGFLQAPSTLAFLRADAEALGYPAISGDRAARRFARWVLKIGHRVAVDSADGGPLSARVEQAPMSREPIDPDADPGEP